MSFEDSLRFGQAGESAIALWLRGKGYSVLPVYETLLDSCKGPQLFTATTSLIAPDMFVFKGERAFWLEAKHKTAFAWHRNSRCWTTGIDLRHYEDYLKVEDETPWPVWIMFLQLGGEARGHPWGVKGTPSGLFSAPLCRLRANEYHRHHDMGGSGMVYWTREEDGGPLRKIAELADVKKACEFAVDYPAAMTAVGGN